MTDEKNLTRIRFEQLLTAILERVTRTEHRLDDVADAVDALTDSIDRTAKAHE